MLTIRHVCVLTACIAFVTACESSTDTQSQVTYTAQLKGTNEVPPNQTTGTGFFVGTLNPRDSTLSYSVTWTGLTARATIAHIHGPADASTNAGILVDFAAPPPGTTNGTSSNLGSGTLTSGSASGNLNLKLTITATVSGDSLLKLFDAGRVYANVHTPANGGGEIRGQITRQQ